jgi:predicted dehydrogenase
MPLTLGVAGYGNMGDRIVRATLAYDPAVLTLSGVGDPSAAVIERLRAALPGVHVFATYEDLLAASNIVHIASPPRVHLAQLQQATAAGVASLCEKPLAVDVPEARTVVRRLTALGARAAVDFPFGVTLAVDQLDAWRAAGLIGDIERIEIEVDFARWPRPQQAHATWLAERAEGGFTREVVSHFVYYLLRTFPPLRLVDDHVTWPADPVAAESSVTAHFNAGGLPVELRAGIGGTGKPDHNLTILHGTKGRIRLRDWAVAERQTGTEWVEAEGSLPNVENRPRLLRRTLDQTIAMARGEPHTLATLEQALAVQEIVETILA